MIIHEIIILRSNKGTIEKEQEMSNKKVKIMETPKSTIECKGCGWRGNENESVEHKIEGLHYPEMLCPKCNSNHVKCFG
jgi:Zn finger protein HypA/HybF involved in hydrogenase expression